MRRISAALLGLALTAPVCEASAQEISARAAEIRFGGRLHAQYSTSSVDNTQNDFFFRRVQLTADATVTDLMEGRVQVDLSGGEAQLKDTYVRLNFSPEFRLSMGQFKRAFDIFEISSDTDLTIIERDGRVKGAGDCAGIGGICSYGRLSSKLSLGGRDQGIRINGSSGAISYMATATNGTGINVADENDGKSYSGRLTISATDMLRASGQVALHDYLDPSDETATGAAWGLDIEYGTWREGLHVQTSVIGGENWEELDTGGNPATFLAFQGVATLYLPVTSERFAAVEPLFRVSIADPNTDMDVDGGVVYTPGFMVYVSGRNMIGVNVDIYSPRTGDTEFGFKLQSFLHF